jgi:hypothetical protein
LREVSEPYVAVRPFRHPQRLREAARPVGKQVLGYRSHHRDSGPQAVEASSLVAGLSLSDNYALYGNDQLVEPLDAQLAASPAQLVEVAGATMAILASDGSVQWSIDLHAMFQLSGRRRQRFHNAERSAVSCGVQDGEPIRSLVGHRHWVTR